MKKLNMTALSRTGFSFILAVLIWLSINGTNTSIITRDIMNIPVTFVGTNELNQKSLVVENQESYYVNLELRGTEENLDQIDSNDLYAEVNLGNIESSGSVSLPVVINGLNNSVILDQTVPSSIQLQIEAITEKDFSPTIITQGRPAEGYTIISATSSETVHISGPADQTDRLASISGIANAEGLSENSFQLVTLSAYDQEGNVLPDIELTPNVVESEIIVGVTKQVSVQAPQVINAPGAGYKVSNVEVKPSSIKIAGSQEAVEEISAIDVNPVVIDNQTQSQTVNISSDMILPENIAVIGSDAIATVKVYIDKVNEKSLNIAKFKIVGLSNNLSVERVNPGSVSVILSGTVNELKQVDNSNVLAIVDVTDLGAGEYTVPVELNAPGVNIVEMKPTNVEIKLTEKT